LSALSPRLTINTEFTLEIKPPSGAVLNVTRTTPAAIEAVMELR
jgi:archaellin